MAHRQSVEDNDVPSDKVRLPKKLIVCCDGTWQDSDNGWTPGAWGQPGHLQNPTNVTRITRAIDAFDDDNHPQIVYYQAGIGTGIGLYDQLVGGGTGMGLSENIREAYAFLAANYSPEDPLVTPDSIFLLGFSRGAFTARSLAGFIGAMGVLTKPAMHFFYQCFLDWENAGNPSYKPMFIEAYAQAHPEQGLEAKKNQPSLALAHDFNKIEQYTFAYRKHLLSLGLTQEVKIKCIGVWDTVGALGIPVNPLLQRALPFLPSFVKQYRWFDTGLDNCIGNAFQALGLDEHRFPFSPSVWEKADNCTTNLKQVWFPGAHSNIGGSYDDYGMANVTLAWMMDQLSGNTRDPSSKFNPVDWIKFDEHYIDRWYDHNLRYYDEKPTRSIYRGWGMGKVYDSDTFPQSVLGRKTRTPGAYHRTDYITGSPTKQVLQNTHEFIHSSVRARIDLAGAAVQPEKHYLAILERLWRWITFQPAVDPYQPERAGGWFSAHGPLNGWKLVDGHDTHREPNLNIDMHSDGLEKIVWKYHGAQTTSTRAMPEDHIAEGGFEHKLLVRDQAIAKQITFTNNRWHWFSKAPPQEARHSQTF